jgi:hypothetical protein
MEGNFGRNLGLLGGGTVLATKPGGFQHPLESCEDTEIARPGRDRRGPLHWIDATRVALC